jgi:hypothetical protein
MRFGFWLLLLLMGAGILLFINFLEFQLTYVLHSRPLPAGQCDWLDNIFCLLI